MRLKILWALLFIVANFLLIKLHILIFHSAWPFSVWVSIGLHGVALLFFPYTIFTPNQSK